MKLSIIIPVYNSENYIENCINSILKQDYKNIEIIVVNDGSTDNSYHILKSLSKKHKQIKLIDKENGGVSSARNVGISVANGDYITFVDIDDYIESDTYSIVFKHLNDSDFDILLFSYNEIYLNKKKQVFFPWGDKIKIFEGKSIMNVFFPHLLGKTRRENNSIMGAVWRIVLRKDIVNQVKFIEGLPIAEDMLFLIDCLMVSKRIITLNECLYNYVRNSSSATGKYKQNFDKINESVHEQLQLRLNKLTFSKNIQLRYSINRFFMYTLSLSNIMKNDTLNFSEKKNYVAKIVKRCNYDKYIDFSTFKNLDNARRFVFILMKLRASYLITILFLIKSGVKKF